MATRTAPRPAVRAPATDSRMQLLFDRIQNYAIFVLETDGTIATWNAGAELLTRRPAGDTLGQHFSILQTDEQRASRHQEHELAVARRKGRYEEEALRLRGDGTLFWASVVITALHDADGTLVGFGTVMRDITERRRREEQQRELQARLEQVRLEQEQVRTAAQSLEQVNRSQRLETVGRLAGGVAHDFNNLLAAIMGYASLVSDNLAGEMASRGLLGDPAFLEIALDVEDISAVAHKAAALTRQLLIFSRRELISPRVLDPSTVVTDVEKLLRRTIGEGIVLTVERAPDVPLVKADRGQLEQVCVNLILNARDASPNGGTVTVTTRAVDVPEEISASTLLPGRYALLEVRDTGTGMSAETAARAVEPYFTTKPRGEGTGLGLATVYGIVTQAGGEVVIESALGVGTSIQVLLPVSTEEPEGAAETSTHRPPRGGGERVLLVEDEPSVREPARRILKRHGYDVICAASGDEAFDLIQGEGPDIDLLLTDVVMPGRSGKDLADDMRAYLPDTPVLFMSGYSEDVIAHQGVVDEGVSLLAKPFSAEALLRSVRAAIDSAVPVLEVEEPQAPDSAGEEGSP